MHSVPRCPRNRDDPQPQQPPRPPAAGAAGLGSRPARPACSRGRGWSWRPCAPGCDARGGGRGSGRRTAPGRDAPRGADERRAWRPPCCTTSYSPLWRRRKRARASGHRRAPPVRKTGLFAGTPLVVVAVGIQNPGNLGGLLRTAEAAGATGALLAGDTADPFSWKALRGSMGSAFRLPHRRERSVPVALIRSRRAGSASRPRWPAVAALRPGRPPRRARAPAGQRGGRPARENRAARDPPTHRSAVAAGGEPQRRRGGRGDPLRGRAPPARRGSE